MVFIHAQLKRVAHIQNAYKCQECSKKSESDKIFKAPVSKAPLAHSLESASIIAYTIHQKFNLKVPNYRQESNRAKLGIPISRKEIAYWYINSAQYYFKPLYSLLSDILKEQSTLHADGTSYRVLESDTNLTYFWTFLSSKDEE